MHVRRYVEDLNCDQIWNDLIVITYTLKIHMMSCRTVNWANLGATRALHSGIITSCITVMNCTGVGNPVAKES